jgi:hypothetical protein
VCRGRSNACNPLTLQIDKNLGNPVVKMVWVRTLADRRGIRILSANTRVPRHVTDRLTVRRLVNIKPVWPRTSSTAAPRKLQHHRL